MGYQYKKNVHINREQGQKQRVFFFFFRSFFFLGLFGIDSLFLLFIFN